MDSYLYKGKRNKLVMHLFIKGIRNQLVLDAIEKVPRHLFIDDIFRQRAYEDVALPIAAGQTISQPYTVAFQTQLLDIKKFDKVLEIGTGSGYQTCILLELGAKVFTIERKRELYQRVITLLPKLGYNPSFHYGDGYQGLPTYGPFDKILITAAAPYFPEALKSQLKIGGLLVAPIGDDKIQEMKVQIKKSDTDFEEMKFGNFAFVPMLKGKD